MTTDTDFDPKKTCLAVTKNTKELGGLPGISSVFGGLFMSK